jgi:hypothetical protein
MDRRKGDVVVSRPTFEKSLDTTTLEVFLREVPSGEFVSYAKLTSVVGRDVRRSSAKAALQSARTSLLREQIRFATIRNEGIRRMTDAEIAHSGAAEIRGVHRRATIGVKRVAAVRDFDALPNDAKIKHNVSAAHLGVLVHVSNSRQTSRLLDRVASAEPWKPTPSSLQGLMDGLKGR